jgi:pimeloyl-ACP methyl ester carboxylesterase
MHEGRLQHFTTMRELVKGAAPYADQIVASSEGRRQATLYTTVNYEHIPHELLAHQIRGVARCDGAEALIDRARRDGFPLDVTRITCPVRIVWGTEDALLSWPEAAVRYQEGLPNADWVEMPGVGHCPQLDVPVEAAQLISGFTADNTT